jgi:heat shock protein HtpX
VPALVVQAGALAGWRLDVDRPLTVGRGQGDVRIEDARLSRRHAELHPLPDGGVGVVDLGSANGTWINGGRISTPTRLGPGDVLRLGDTSLALERAPAKVPAAASPPGGYGPSFAFSGPSARGAFKPHWGLRTRMLVTMALLALAYLGWIAALILAGGSAWFWAVIAVIVGLVQVLAADRIGLVAVGGRVVTPAQAPELHAIVERLCVQAGLRKPRVAVADSPVPNALALGRGPRSATVCVTTSLMRLLSPAEIEGVLAHELSHIRNRDALVMTIAGFGMLAVGWMLKLYRVSMRLFLAVLVVAGALWVVSRVLVSALSRHRELVADRDAALLTGRPSALASALMKVTGEGARIPHGDLRAVAGMNAFFIVPAGARAALRLLATHPPVEARVAALQQLERELQGNA